MILFFGFRLNIFTSMVSNLSLPLGRNRPGNLNLVQPVLYSINISVMLFQSFIYLFCVVVFSLFGSTKELNGDSQRL